MALLNYASSIDDLKNINSAYDLNNLNTWDANDQVKLIFTGDQHIITHGVDLLKDYSNGERGLVPKYTVGNNYAVLGKNGWANITTDLLPMSASIQASADNNLLSAKQIVDYVTTSIADGFAANDAMVFKGGIAALTDIKPPYSAGYTYRATGSFTFTSGSKTHYVTSGDVIIAVKDSETGDTSAKADDFIVVEANINGTSELTINGTVWNVYGETLYSSQNFYAPTGPGTAGQVLVSTNNTPEWVDQDNITAGKLKGASQDGFYTASTLLSSVSAVNGEISVTVGDATKKATASGSWNINAASANKVNNALSAGGGLYFNAANVTYDGSAARTLSLLPATTTTIGGVIADPATNPTVTINSDGTLHITSDNIINALGYKPTAPNDIMEYNIVNTIADGIVPAFKDGNLGSDVSANTYLLAFNGAAQWCKLSAESLNNTWRPIKVGGSDFLTDSETSLNIIAGTNVTLNTNSGNLTISATDTTYTKATNAQDGLMSKEDFIKLSQIESGAQKNVNAFATITAGAGSISASTTQDTVKFIGENIDIFASTEGVKFTVAMLKGATASTNGTAGLVTVPTTNDIGKFLRGDGTWATPANDNTWRNIKVENVSLGSTANGKELTIKAGNNVSVNLDSNTGELVIASSYTNTTYTAGTGLNLVNTQFSLKNAAADEIGGIKIGYSENNKKYAVKLDVNNKAYVEVPWTDTNIRDIQVNGTSIGTKTLNIKPSEEIHIIKDDSKTDDVYEIGFGLSWFNLSTGKYEYSNN